MALDNDNITLNTGNIPHMLSKERKNSDDKDCKQRVLVKNKGLYPSHYQVWTNARFSLAVIPTASFETRLL